MTSHKNWEELVKKAEPHRDQTLAEIEPPLPSVPSQLRLDVTGTTAKLPSPEEVEITEKYDTSSLAMAIASKKYSAETVVMTFLRPA